MKVRVLSTEARWSLRDRLRVLEEERIPRLERELGISGDVAIEAALQATREEAAGLREALAMATPLEKTGHDPTIVEIGDTVTIRRPGSRSRDRFTLVGELEARLDPSWISVEAPLGSALLGARIGEFIDVKAPSGDVQYEVLRIEPAA